MYDFYSKKLPVGQEKIHKMNIYYKKCARFTDFCVTLQPEIRETYKNKYGTTTRKVQIVSFTPGIYGKRGISLFPCHYWQTGH
jgi:hypothetical protein